MLIKLRNFLGSEKGFILLLLRVDLCSANALLYFVYLNLFYVLSIVLLMFDAFFLYCLLTLYAPNKKY